MITKQQIETAIENQDDAITHMIKDENKGDNIAILQDFEGAAVVIVFFEGVELQRGKGLQWVDFEIKDFEVIENFNDALQLLGDRILMR